MAKNKISGNILGLEIDGKFIACETSCELTYEADMRGVSPETSGGWKEWLPGARTWSINLNATALLKTTGADYKTVLEAFVLRKRLKIRFKSKKVGVSNFAIVGFVFAQNGSFTAAVNTNVGYSNTFLGDGPFTIGDASVFVGYYGYRLTDPFGDEINLQPQFSKEFPVNASTIDFDFTRTSDANYLFAIIPKGQPVYNEWKNNAFNYGPIPDYLWRKVTVGDYDYYMTRAIQYITSAVPVVTFIYNPGAPASFSFIGVNNVEPNSLNTSNTITVSGITVPLNYSIVNGTVSKNGGPFTSVGGTVVNGDTLTLQQTATSSYNTMVITSLTVGSFTTGYSVGTRAALPVTVNYNINYSLNPYVWMGYIPMRNGIEVNRILSEATGSITGVYFEGDEISFRQVTFPMNFPWVPGSGAYMQIDRNASLLYQNTVTLQTTELQNPTYIIPPGTTSYDVNMVGINTGITGWVTHTLQTLNGPGYNVTIKDSVTLDLYIYFDVNPGDNTISINQRNTTDLNTVTITNNDSIGNSYRIQGVSGYDETIAIGVGLQGTKTDVPKGSITITKL